MECTPDKVGPAMSEVICGNESRRYACMRTQVSVFSITQHELPAPLGAFHHPLLATSTTGDANSHLSRVISA